MLEPFTLITMICWMGGPPNFVEDKCDFKTISMKDTNSYLECVVRANEYIRKESDPIFSNYGGTHKIAFCLPQEQWEWLYGDDDVLTASQYDKVWAEGNIRTTYKKYITG